VSATCQTKCSRLHERKENAVAGPLALDRDAISAACERYGVKRLVVFGSAVTDRFDESSSDVDFLVEFRGDLASRFDAYFGLKQSLEALLGRPVDLVSRVALENPYFAASVEENGFELFAA
jgi:predicted nucleotidyltransferase